jgi:hypothetical protein
MFSRYSHLTRLVGLVAVVMSLAVGTATASTAGGTALWLNEDGLRGLNADGLRLQGMADRYQWLQGLKADGLRLQAAARSYENRPAASYYTPEALKAQALRWQGIAATYKPVVASTSGSSFDWRDAGIGAGVGVVALLGFTLLVVAGRRVRGEKLAV